MVTENPGADSRGEEYAKATVAEPEPLCEHRCLKDDGHVERGELHFYGYNLPSDRSVIERLTSENERLRKVLTDIYMLAGDAVEEYEDSLRSKTGRIYSMAKTAAHSRQIDGAE